MKSTTEKIRLTKQFNFEMAHALHGYDGPCRNIHGHSYVLQVTLIGEPQQNPGHPKDGMLIDFGDIKKMVQDAVINEFDHALAINTSHNEIADLMKKEFPGILEFNFQPSCENLVIEIKNRLQKVIKDPYRLFSVKLQETASSWAEWCINDHDNRN